MQNQVYLVATVKPWNIKRYIDTIQHYPGEWHLITEPKDLTVEKINILNPTYIFFPHWNHIVPQKILETTTCICFHETDLPYGRGGSPVQNLIVNGHKDTMISAIKMVEELDAGPIYLKQPLSVEGQAEEIFIRASHIVALMIKTIIDENPVPVDQTGTPVVFSRRTPDQSQVPLECRTIEDLFDHIRMLDAHGYPKAFIDNGCFRFEISRPSLRTDGIIADLRIIPKNGDKDV